MQNQRHPKVSAKEMKERIVRFNELDESKGVPLMFIDSILPGHHRLNYAVVGDTASENPDYEVLIDQPHEFQLGLFKCLPGCGPAMHTHDYIECFLLLTGKWRFYWSNDPDTVEDEVTLNQFDLISFPPGLWRGFENVSDIDAWAFGVLEQHEVFKGQDPYWPDWLVDKAREAGLEVDENGKMIKSDNFDELQDRMFRLVTHKDEK